MYNLNALLNTVAAKSENAPVHLNDRYRPRDAGIGYGRMNDMADLWAHPQLAARKRWREVGSPVGPIPALLPPGANPAFEARMDPVPALGQHSEAILAELGFAQADRARLAQEGAV